MKISSKREFYQLYTAGLLGNTVRMWSEPNADLKALADNVELVGFREIGRAGGGSFIMVPAIEITKKAYEWRKIGKVFNISEAAPDHLVTLQGEICKTFDGWHGIFSTQSGIRMREAMKIARSFKGLAVKQILDTFMDINSREFVDDMFEFYPDCTIEFACYSKDVGCISNRNTIIWEVRDY